MTKRGKVKEEEINNVIALTIKERLLISQLYPRESSLTEQIIIRDISRKVEFSQKEQKEFGLKPIDKGFTWEPKKEVALQIDFTEMELNLLKDRIKKLDEDKKITQQLVELCLKIKNI